MNPQRGLFDPGAWLMRLLVYAFVASAVVSVGAGLVVHSPWVLVVVILAALWLWRR